LVAEAFDPTDSSEARGKNNRLLPHALAVLAYAPREGPTSWSTMFILQKIGDVLADLYELPDALTFYRSALALAERGAKFDSSNPHWQVAIAELHICIGEVLKDQGKRPAARDAYKAALATRERLTKIDPSNVDWRHALAECYVNIDPSLALWAIALDRSVATLLCKRTKVLVALR